MHFSISLVAAFVLLHAALAIPTEITEQCLYAPPGSAECVIPRAVGEISKRSCTPSDVACIDNKAVSVFLQNNSER